MWLAIAALGCTGVAACDESKDQPAPAAAAADGKAAAGPTDPPGEAKAPAADAAEKTDAPDAGADEKDADKGTATLTIGDASWTAERASARLREKRLSISASRMKMEAGKADRQALSLTIQDFTGPGDYKAATGSSFVGVGFDVDAAKAAEGDDAKTTAVAKKALTGADIVMLTSADVHITTATDDRIEGTVSWKGTPGGKGPSSLQGEFAAVVKKTQ